MFCEKCGSPLPEGTKFCMNCGQKIETAESVQPAAQEAAVSVDAAVAGIDTAAEEKTETAKQPELSSETQSQQPESQPAAAQPEVKSAPRPAAKTAAEQTSDAAPPRQAAQTPAAQSPGFIPPRQAAQTTAAQSPGFTPARQASQTASQTSAQPAAQNYQQYYHAQQPMAPQSSEKVTPLQTWKYILMIIVTGIPVLGLIMVLVWSFGGSFNRNTKNFARAILILWIIGLVLLIAGIIVNWAMIQYFWDSFNYYSFPAIY